MVENSSTASSGILAPIFLSISPAQGFHLPDQLLVQAELEAGGKGRRLGRHCHQSPTSHLRLISGSTARWPGVCVCYNHQVSPRKEVGNGHLVRFGE